MIDGSTKTAIIQQQALPLLQLLVLYEVIAFPSKCEPLACEIVNFHRNGKASLHIIKKNFLRLAS